VEVLASLLLMAIIIPVAMEGMSVASRVGILGQRKAAAMRVGERVLNELMAEQQTQQNSASGTAYDRDTAYTWTMRVENWPEDAMQQMTVAVSFSVQGNTYEVLVTTLLPSTGAAEDPLAGAGSTTQ
jgi:type II secretory pathway pseudopilin PulG